MRGTCPSSDLDILVIRPTDPSEDDPAWSEQLVTSGQRIHATTGNHVAWFNVSRADLRRAPRASEPIVDEWRRDALRLTGTDLRALVRRALISQQPTCGPAEARNRAKVARMYLDVAEPAADEPGDEARHVTAGNAVLAGIAASDAVCCLRLGKRHRGQDHHAAGAVLRAVHPDGPKLAADLAAVLAVKDPSHYGEKFISDTKLEATMRAAARLVDTAETLIVTA